MIFENCCGFHKLGFQLITVVTSAKCGKHLCFHYFNQVTLSVCEDQCYRYCVYHTSCDELFVHITLLFNAILVHGALPDNFLRSTIVPIPKGRNADGSNNNNYRGIALSSIFGKLMDNIVLIKFSNQLQTSSLQFGFKAKSSTNLCTFVLRETLAYYVNNQTTMFCTIGMPQKPSTELIIVNSLGC